MQNTLIRGDILDKKAQMMMSPRKIISLILGFLILVMGLLPILKQLKVIKFAIPTLPVMLVSILLIAGAIFLVADGWGASMGMVGATTFFFAIIALVVLAFGLIPLLAQLKVIPFNIPTSANTALPWIHAASGIMLIIGGFMGM